MGSRVRVCQLARVLSPDFLSVSSCLQMPEQDELLWDDGSAQPEWCLDQFPLVGKVRHPMTALSWDALLPLWSHTAHLVGCSMRRWAT